MEDFADLFIDILYIQSFNLHFVPKKIPMVSTKSRLWLDTRVKEIGAECHE